MSVLSLTCSPTLIFLVKAPSGKEACTNGMLRLQRVPPSGPIWLVSCRIRDTTAKYCGKSLVMMRQILFLSSSSGLSSSTGRKINGIVDEPMIIFNSSNGYQTSVLATLI